MGIGVNTIKGLTLRSSHMGWGVWHQRSGLPLVVGLRQRRFAVEARHDFLATGIVFDRDAPEIQRDVAAFGAVYYKWGHRAESTAINPETYEFYAFHVPFGAAVPSQKEARAMRERMEIESCSEVSQELSGPLSQWRSPSPLPSSS